MINTTPIATVANALTLKGEIGFSTARQLLLLLFVITQFKNDENGRLRAIIPKGIIVRFLTKGGRTGSAYKEVSDFIDKMMMGNYIKFPSNVHMNGETLPNYVAIFEHAKPIKDENGIICYDFLSTFTMSPFIEHLKKEFVQLPIPFGMKSGHTVRFYMGAKTQYDKMKAYRNVVDWRLSVVELKRILGIEGKYKKFKDFRRNVIEQIEAGMNKIDIVKIKEIEYIKTGRQVTDINFKLVAGDLYNYNQKDNTLELKDGSVETVPSHKEVANLSRSQFKAYNYLVERHCKAGIVFSQIIPKMPSSEYLGWEDIFVQKSWEYFEKSTKHTKPRAKAGAFIKWWVKGEFKDRLFSSIMEAVQLEKKNTSEEGRKNREQAKKMTNLDFEKWYEKEKASKGNIATEKVTKAISKGNQIDLERINFDFDKWRTENPEKYNEIEQEQLNALENVLGEKAKDIDFNSKIKMISGRIQSKILELKNKKSK